jgi:MscS family membrane protein
MITILGFPVQLPPTWQSLAGPWASFLTTILAWAGIVFVVYLLLNYVLRWLVRRIPGELAGIFLDIARWPVLILLIAFALASSLRLLGLPEAAQSVIERVFYTLLTLVVVYLSWHVIKDVLVYYGAAWAAKTESRVDDILVPILNLLGPLFILIAASLIILPLWGVDVGSVLVGAGVVGLVLGLALQDTLSNIFSGISLLVEAPFRTRDLIVLPEGKLCEVVRIGLRSTELYSLDEHSTVYVPNKTLVSSNIVNITKPTFEQKTSFAVTVKLKEDLPQVQTLLEQIALAHPNVLTADSAARLPLIRERVRKMRGRAATLDPANLWHTQLLAIADKYEQAIQRLEVESTLDHELRALRAALDSLAEAVSGREGHGLSAAEVQALRDCCVTEAEQRAHQVAAAAAAWSNTPDPWASAAEIRADQTLWQERNERLLAHWHHLEESLAQPWRGHETRLDDLVCDLQRWLAEEYKLLPENWKSPSASVEGFEGDAVNLRLWFYIDNVRMEHYGRAGRVRDEIAREVRSQLLA